jgi:hypothetical protein
MEWQRREHEFGRAPAPVPSNPVTLLPIAKRFATIFVAGALATLLATSCGGGESHAASGKNSTTVSPDTKAAAALRLVEAAALIRTDVEPGATFKSDASPHNGLEMCGDVYPAATGQLSGVIVFVNVTGNGTFFDYTAAYRDTASAQHALAAFRAVASQGCHSGKYPLESVIRQRIDADWPSIPTVARFAVDILVRPQVGVSMPTSVVVQQHGALLQFLWATASADFPGSAGVQSLEQVASLLGRRLAGPSQSGT